MKLRKLRNNNKKERHKVQDEVAGIIASVKTCEEKSVKQ